MFVTPPVMHYNDSGWYLSGLLQENLPVDMLLDTGATFSLLPSEVFDELPPHLRPEIDPAPGCHLTGFTGEQALVRGRVNLKFGTGKHTWNVMFLVVYRVTNCILGASFMKENGIRIDYAQGLVWINQTFSPMLREINNSNSARTRKGHDILPSTEGVVEAYIDCFPPDSIVMVEGTMEDLEKGFVVANAVVTLGAEGKCLLRVMNPGKYPLTIQPCNMGRVSLVSSVQTVHPLV